VSTLDPTSGMPRAFPADEPSARPAGEQGTRVANTYGFAHDPHDQAREDGLRAQEEDSPTPADPALEIEMLNGALGLTMRENEWLRRRLRTLRDVSDDPRVVAFIDDTLAPMGSTDGDGIPFGGLQDPRPSRVVGGYEAYKVGKLADGRWEARYDGRVRGHAETEEAAWDVLRALARVFGDLPQETTRG